MEERGFLHGQGRCARVFAQPGSGAERGKEKIALLFQHEPLAVVAVLLVLPVIFMVKDPPILHDIGPDLPSGLFATAQPKALREDAMKILLTRDGRLYFRSTRVAAKSLPILIRGAVQEGAERKVYLAVDAPKVFSIHAYPAQKPCAVSCNIKSALERALSKSQKAMEASLCEINLASIVSDMKKK